MKTEILLPSETERAVNIILNDGTVALPTETVWGICANGLSEEAIKAVYEAKGRPETKPMSLFVSDMGMAEKLCADIPEEAYKLAEAYWPGPLTMVLKKKAVVPIKFDAHEYFRNYFGIIASRDPKPVLIEIKVVKDQVKYIESLPLHHSQEKILETPEYNVYRFFLVPTFDFRQEILSHGPDYEVLSPEPFRDELKAEIVKMCRNYGL